MVVSDNIKAVGILIPKTGTRSILHYMKKYHNGRLEGNHRIDIPEEYQDYYSFCVVRNPYTRIVSHWYGGSQRDDKNNKKYRFEEVIGDRSFESYLKYLLNKENYKQRLRWPFEVKQVAYMNNNYNEVLQFERLDDDIKKLPFFNSQDHKLGHRNVTRTVSDNNPTPRKAWYEYYTQEILDMVNEYYKDDFIYLNNNVYGKDEYPVFQTIEELKEYGRKKELY